MLVGGEPVKHHSIKLEMVSSSSGLNMKDLMETF